MKTLGLIGGTSWHSTAEYYRIINQATNDHFGNNTNPPLILFNMNQAIIHGYQNENNWQAIAELAVNSSERLVNAGAEAVMFCANTPHKVFTSSSRGFRFQSCTSPMQLRERSRMRESKPLVFWVRSSR